jgi:hypothetical protein
MTEYGQSVGVDPMGDSSNRQFWLRDSPFADQSFVSPNCCSLRLFLPNSSFLFLFLGVGSEVSPSLPLFLFHLSFKEIYLNKSAHLILSWHLLLRGL